MKSCYNDPGDTSTHATHIFWGKVCHRILNPFLSNVPFVGGQSKAHGENKRGGGMKISVRIYLRREDCGSCGRQVGAKINIWM